MNNVAADQLYQLLPAIYRLRDAEGAEPLRRLLAALAAQAELVEEDTARLYESWFIETCDEWLVPYIGDLLGVRGLLPPERAGWSQRALVANTLRYRRRKGTVPLLEQLAHDVAGWEARAVELFNSVAVTPHLDHPRPGLGVAASLRALRDTALVGSAFDPLAYTPDVRLMSGTRHAPELDAERPVSWSARQLAGVGQARPNLPNIALFVWRLKPVPASNDAHLVDGPSDSLRYTFDQNGDVTQLYHQPAIRDYSRVAREYELPVALRRDALDRELETYRRADAAGHPIADGFFGPARPFTIKRAVAYPEEAGKTYLKAFTPAEILIADLTSWGDPTTLRRLPRERVYAKADGTGKPVSLEVAVDPQLGRLVLLHGSAVDVQVDYFKGGAQADAQQQARREGALLAQIEEYLRFGLELGLIYVT